jgi:hypothetical protein
MRNNILVVSALVAGTIVTCVYVGFSGKLDIKFRPDEINIQYQGAPKKVTTCGA